MLQAAPALTTTALTVADIDTTVNCEPRVLDTKLGKGLGMARPTNIRSQIEANRTELESFGSLHAARAMIETGKGARREVVSYYLTEGQALCICALSRAPNAPKVRRELIEAFMELRHGRFDEAIPAKQTVPALPPKPPVRLVDLFASACTTVVKWTEQGIVEDQDAAMWLAFEAILKAHGIEARFRRGEKVKRIAG